MFHNCLGIESGNIYSKLLMFQYNNSCSYRMISSSSLLVRLKLIKIALLSLLFKFVIVAEKIIEIALG